MSWRAAGYVKGLRVGLTVTDKFVLLILADYHRTDEKSAWPSVATIALDCLMTERGVQQILSRLEENGFIVKKSGCGRGNVSGYQIIGVDIEKTVKDEQETLNSGSSFIVERTNGHAKKDAQLCIAIRKEPIEEPIKQTFPPDGGLFGDTTPKSKVKTKSKKTDPNADPRQSEFTKFTYEEHRRRTGKKPAWGGREAGNLGTILRRYPELTLKEFEKWITNYWNSNIACRLGAPYIYLAKLEQFTNGPLNEYWHLDATKVRPDWQQGESTVDRLRRENAPLREEALRRWEKLQKQGVGTADGK